MNERERKIRERRAVTATHARAILDAGPAEGKLGPEDQTRYDGLMTEYDDLGVALEQELRLATAERDLAQPLTAPTRPDPAPSAGAPKRAKRMVAQPEYKTAFRRYLMSGRDIGSLMTFEGSLSPEQQAEQRALQMDSDVTGGYLVAPQDFSDQIIKFADNAVVIRGLATKVRVPNAMSLGVPQLTVDPDDADWTTELQTGNEDSSMAFGKREWRPWPLAKELKISNKLIRAAAVLTEFAEDGTESPMSVDGLVQERLAYKFAVAEEKGYMTGSGALQPLGVFTPSTDGIDTSRDVIASGPTPTVSLVGDDFINTKYSLKSQYQNSRTTRWLLNRIVVREVRKLKDLNGQYIWAPSGIGQANLAGDQADTILDIPFLQSEYAPSTFTAGLYLAILGDWRYFWIADALDFTVQRLVELYARSNQIAFLGRKETDGMPVLAEAFSRLALHA